MPSVLVYYESATDNRCTVRVEDVDLTFAREGKGKMITVVGRSPEPDVRRRVGDAAFAGALREARRVMDMPAAERLAMLPKISSEDREAAHARLQNLKGLINSTTLADRVAETKQAIKKREH